MLLGVGLGVGDEIPNGLYGRRRVNWIGLYSLLGLGRMKAFIMGFLLNE